MTEKQLFPLLIYSAVFVFYIYTLKCFHDNDEYVKKNYNPAKTPKSFMIMGKYQKFYFTLWTFLLQIIFVTVAVFDELTKLLGLPSAVKNIFGKTRAFIFNALLFPCTITVIVTFWTIWHIDRELIFPKAIDEFFPSWLNHVLHTFIGIPIFLEVLLPKRDHFIKFKTAAIALLLYCVVYQTLYFSIYFKDGVWLYPVYKVLDWPQRFIFNVVQVALILAFQYIGLAIQNSKKTNLGKKKVK